MATRRGRARRASGTNRNWGDKDLAESREIIRRIDQELNARRVVPKNGQPRRGRKR